MEFFKNMLKINKIINERINIIKIIMILSYHKKLFFIDFIRNGILIYFKLTIYYGIIHTTANL